MADCFEEKGRKLKEQHVIPFDIDKLAGDTDEDVIHQAELAARAACEALGIHYEQTGVIFSGNGVQLFVRIAYPILSDDYFEATRPHYAELCRRIQSKLLELGVSGEIDTSVFSAARLMRFPLTYNVKPGKPKRIAKILQKKIEIQNFYIEQLSGLDELQGPEQIRMDVIKNYPEPDARAVQDGCEFLKHCFVNPAKISEPQWYAAASIVPRLYKDEDKGKALFHEMSAGHPSYNFYETELKAEQALLNAGPRTCKNIDTLWDGCKTCPHFGTDLVSPILIHGPDYIKSKDFGFREMREDKNGNLISGKPAYDDLIKQFEKENKFVSIIEENCIYTFIDTHWREYLKTELFIWMTDKVVPRPSGAEMKEFYDRIRARNGRRNDWFIGSTEGKMNFQNGILNINTLEMSPHDPELGFTHVLPYNYDKNAECPKYDKFMSEVIDDPEVVRVLNEFAGYAIAGGECLAQKALVLLGVGSNGKTVFAETIAKVVGDKNFSALLISALNNDQMRAILQNKLFNFSDEASLYSLRDSSDFKSLVTGGFTTAKVVYKAPSIFKNKAKFIVLTNELPKAYDTSEGYFRRLILVDFNKKFEGANDNKNIRSEIWAELPGICRKYVMAYKDLRDRKFSFDEPQTIKDAVEAYREESNNVALFFSEEVEITDSPDDRVPLPEVYSKYQSWCVAAGEKPKERGMFTSAAKKLKKLSHCDVSKVIKENGKFIRVITNIKYLGEF